MSGWPDNSGLTRWWGDLPASYHGRAGGPSFADGHASIRRWLDPRTTPNLVKGKLALSTATALIPQPNNKDIVWLQERAIRRVR